MVNPIIIVSNSHNLVGSCIKYPKQNNCKDLLNPVPFRSNGQFMKLKERKSAQLKAELTKGQIKHSKKMNTV